MLRDATHCKASCHLTNSFRPLRCWPPLGILLGELLLGPVGVEAESVHGEHPPGAGGGLAHGLGHEHQETQGEAGPGHGGHQLGNWDSDRGERSLIDTLLLFSICEAVTPWF